ncbi:MAG: hypothetical protein FWG54_03300, partial [Bacteroidetes bacterium]|nr:hypothetical protein [Bacteroidota bacterium]
MQKFIGTLFFILSLSASLRGQVEKKRLTLDDVVKWNRITERQIAPDASFIAVKLEPWVGSATVKLYDNKGNEIFSADSSSAVRFSKDSQYLLYKKGEGKKASLHIYSLKNKSDRIEEGLKNYHLPKAWIDLLVIEKNDSTLCVEKLDGSHRISMGKATALKFAEKSDALIFWADSCAMIYRAGASAPESVWDNRAKVDRMAISESGKNVSLVAGAKLYLWDGSQLEELTTNVSDKRDPYFSPDGSKLFFGVKPPARTRDTTLKKEDFPEVHIWHWQEKVQFTQQVINKKRDLDANYLAVYDLNSSQQTQLTSETLTGTQLIHKGNSEYVLALSDLDYQLESMWEGRGSNDLYLINTALNKTDLVVKGVSGQVRVSPASNYA